MALGRIYIALGSNCQAAQNIASGLALLKQRFGSLSVSGIYRSQPLQGDGEDYLNAVVCFAYQGTLEKLKVQLLAIEDLHGRQRGADSNDITTLDLDILALQGIGRAGHCMEVPQDALERSFVLAPLSQLAGDVREQHSGETFAQLWQQMDKAKHPLCEVALPGSDDVTR